MQWKISRLTANPMRDIDAHEVSSDVERFASFDLPIHVAAHNVTGSPSRKYCQEHTHHDCHELNLVLPGSNGLTYSLNLDGNRHLIDYPAAIWLPPGASHSANALQGTGWFVCVRLSTPWGPSR